MIHSVIHSYSLIHDSYSTHRIADAHVDAALRQGGVEQSLVGAHHLPGGQVDGHPPATLQVDEGLGFG